MPSVADDQRERHSAIMRLYYFLLSDAYREYREEELRWECYAASQYHFDDGVALALEASGSERPVDHPLWRAYSEKIAEIAARVARAEERKGLKLAVLKGVHAGFLRFCRQNELDPRELAGPRLLGSEKLAALDRSPEVAPSGEAAREAYGVLAAEWERHATEAQRRVA
jgi:hypothetical protein